MSAVDPLVGGAPPTYQSDSDSDSGSGEYAAYGNGRGNLLAELKADDAKSPDSAIQQNEVCEDYYDADEDENANDDLFSRQVMARKQAASGKVSKLLCDEVDGVVEDAPAPTEEPTDALSRALSRGKSMGGIGRGGRSGMARSKSQFGSAARADREARDRGLGNGNSEAMNEKLSQGDAARRVVRTRGAQGPAPVVPRNTGFGRNASGDGDEGMGRRPTLDMLNALSEKEDGPPRKVSIRFA